MTHTIETLRRNSNMPTSNGRRMTRNGFLGVNPAEQACASTTLNGASSNPQSPDGTRQNSGTTGAPFVHSIATKMMFMLSMGLIQTCPCSN